MPGAEIGPVGMLPTSIGMPESEAWGTPVTGSCEESSKEGVLEGTTHVESITVGRPSVPVMVNVAQVVIPPSGSLPGRDPAWELEGPCEPGIPADTAGGSGNPVGTPPDTPVMLPLWVKPGVAEGWSWSGPTLLPLLTIVGSPS